MREIWLFSLFFLLISPTFAVADDCVQAAMADKLVRLHYNYGTLGFDPSKSQGEVNAICSDTAAGCFWHHNIGGGRWTIEDKFYNVGRKRCVAPMIDISYDFSGSVIYISRENDSCRIRAILRHELEHFAIWKTSREWFIKDLKQSLQQAAAGYAVQCKQRKRCHTNSFEALSAVVDKVEKRWNNIETKNQNLLDQVDHSAKHQVNYPVCAPYSLKVELF